MNQSPMHAMYHMLSLDVLPPDMDYPTFRALVLLVGLGLAVVLTFAGLPFVTPWLSRFRRRP